MVPFLKKSLTNNWGSTVIWAFLMLPGFADQIFHSLGISFEQYTGLRL